MKRHNHPMNPGNEIANLDVKTVSNYTADFSEVTSCSLLCFSLAL
jgi:hypothetical protein